MVVNFLPLDEVGAGVADGDGWWFAAEMTSEAKALYRQWIDEMWNGDHSVANELVADNFVGHWPDRDVHGVRGLLEAMVPLSEMFESISFEIEVGPISEDDMVAGRWRGQGTTSGGESMTFIGNDLLRIADGQFVEYWVATQPV